MWKSRRDFIRKSFASIVSLAASSMLSSIVNAEEENESLTILHTNDLHSHVEAFPMDGGKDQGIGGMTARASIISNIRNQNNNVLLLDSGDIFGNTPYFNLYKGEPEIKAMSLMKYDAVTLGENDLLGGIDNYSDQIKRHANFDVVLCNYDTGTTALESIIQPYKVYQKGKLKIGVTGVSIAFEGLLTSELYSGITYLDPAESVNKTADILKRKENCDIIICLSHLGDKYYEGGMSDDVLARETNDVDLIIGGHTHRSFNEPRRYINQKGKEVIVNQCGWAGTQLGRLDYKFTVSGKKVITSKTLLIGKKYED